MIKIFGKKILKKYFYIALIAAILLAVSVFFGFNIFRKAYLDSINLFDSATLGNIARSVRKIKNDINSNISYKTYDDEMSVHFLNVGKADCAYIKCKNVNILIDAADKEPGNVVVEYLKSQKLEKLDMVIMSHPHRDHIGQMANVINEFKVDKFIDVKMTKDIIPITLSYEKMLKALINKKVPVEFVSAGKKLNIGDLKISILGPVRLNKENINDNSIVMKVVYKNVSFLFTGDASKTEENDIIKHYGLYDSRREKLINKLSNKYNSYEKISRLKISNKSKNVLKSDVLKVGHHGSNSSSTHRFLELINPKYAVISTVSKETMGMSSGWRWRSLERLQKYCSKIYKTYESGNVIFLTDGKNIKVETEK